VWSKYESLYIDFSSLVALRLEGFRSVTWGTLVLVTICKPTGGSNVISPMSSTIILGGLMSGSIYMFEVFISVYCAFDSRMMIQVNGVFELNGGNISMEPINCMGVC
jgi:hypothetical protein